MLDFIIKFFLGSKYLNYPNKLKMLLVILMIFLFFLMGSFLFYIYQSGIVDKDKLKQAIIIILASIFLANYVLDYLNNNSKQSRVNEELNAVRNEFGNIYRLIRKNDLGRSINSLNINSDERQELLDSVKNNIEKDVNLSYLKQLKGMISESNLDDFLEKKISSSYDRLSLERESLARRGNLNLMIGMFLSIGGLIVLGYSILNYDHTGDLQDLLIFIIPKISFVLLIELFAYFFLNLYKKSLEDIKYYQNEITNMEAKYLSLQMAKSMNNHKLISGVLEQLVKTERNFVLEKDQSTIELEKERISSNNANNTLQAIKEIFLNKK